MYTDKPNLPVDRFLRVPLEDLTRDGWADLIAYIKAMEVIDAKQRSRS